MKNAIADLPEQLVQTVLGFLDKKGVCNVRQVCASLRASRAAWRYVSVKAWKNGEAANKQAVCVPACVRKLHFSCSAATRLLEPIRLFPNLEELRVCSQRYHDIVMLSNLLFHTKIKHLAFYDCAFLGFDMRYIAALPLESLAIARATRLKKKDFARIAKITTLTCLEVFNELEEGSLASLQGLTNLQHLALNSSTFSSEADLSFIASLVNLKKLNLWFGRKITDAGLVHLSTLVHLEDFSLNDSYRITSIASLSRLTNLQHLSLAECLMMTDAGLACVANFTNLRTLNLAACMQITSAALVHIKHLSCLVELILAYTSVCDRGLELVSQVASLTDLDLSNLDDISDAGLTHLVALRNLRALDLQACKWITNAGIQQIDHMELDFFNVDECPHVTH